ncbi:MAG: ATP-binding protein [Alphaproteobacteria bacterium]|uniref:AAA+ ATPase domain-containing protein n=1 Tax=viral metagenome TaxID=1070528 RepID=A0A6C0HPY6_9ZZZZ|nr:ATP-binding protein [Alphaproteobacteria bacterium]
MSPGFDLTEILQTTFNDSIKISLFQRMKTGNQLFDAIFSTIGFVVISYLVKVLYENNSFNRPWNIDIHDAVKSLFYKKYSITYEGKRCSSVGTYNLYPVVSSCFTNACKALWSDIVKNMDKNESIRELKELYIAMDKFRDKDDEDDESDMYIVSQKKPFLYNKELQIYAIADFYTEDSGGGEKDKQTTKTDKITLTLYSYETNTYGIKNYVTNLTNSYTAAIEKSRNNQKFVYTLVKTKYEDYKYECWAEYPFDSTRTFSNMFFENQKQIVDKIQFFLDNKEWYYEMGIPYSLGIGLHGPPGTGKTSFFKCLANMTGRHLIVLSLKLIKTRRQLDDFFFEDRYNSNNKNHGVGFDKKIIIIEDIDCLGEIVWKRENKKDKHGTNIGKKLNLNSLSPNATVNVADVIQTFVDANEEQNKLLTSVTKSTEDDPITLDDILNLWDGLKETPGRILGISSNHYDMLDPALIRPGRIDITLKLDNVSHNIIREMHKRYYNANVDERKLKKIKDKFYSPAEIINCYVMNKHSPRDFIERLMQNEKF